MITRAAKHSVLPRAVRSALEAMEVSPEHDWSPSELAGRAKVSSRTLQRQFKTFLGSAPRAVLQNLRFETARRKLLRATATTKVVDVALDSGFAHCGRFSIGYRARYGETPSQTIERQSLTAAAPQPFAAACAMTRHRPTIALGCIEAASEHAELARHLANDLTMGLLRAGISVSTRRASSRYELTGHIAHHAGRPQLALRLIDAMTDRLIWACRADSDLTDVELLAPRIVAALQPCLRLAEIERVRRVPDQDLAACDLALKAMPGVIALDADGNARALDLLERAMLLDPDDALATALSAWAHAQRIVYHFTTTPDDDRSRAAQLAHKARMQSGDATVLAVLGNALTLINEIEAAETVIRRALSIDGGSAWAWSRSGWINLYKGDTAAAIERFKIALDIAPDDQLAFNSQVGIGCAHFEAGEYGPAAIWQERALRERPSAIWVHRTLCPSYLLSGARTEATRSLAKWRTASSELTIAQVEQGLPPLSTSCRARIVGALSDAGLPL